MHLRRRPSVSRQLLRRVMLLGASAMLSFILLLLLALRIAEEDVRDRMSTAGSRAAIVLDQELGAIQDDLRATGDAMAAVLDQPTQARQVFRRALLRRSSIFELALLDPDGQVMVQRHRVFDRYRDQNLVALRPWAKDLSVGEIAIGPVEFEAVGEIEIPFLRFTVPVIGEAEAVVGALQARVDLSSLWSTITSIPVGSRGHVYLTDSGDRVLVHQDLRWVRGDTRLASAIGRSAKDLAQPGLHLYPSLDGSWVVGTSFVLEELPWYALIEEPAVDALAPPLIQAAVLAMLVLALGWLSLSILRFTQRRLADPLAQLRAGVERIGRGDLAHRIRIDSQDELGALAAEFNAMAAELQATIDDLQQRVAELRGAQGDLREARDNLERGVEERTADLQAATQEMKALLYMVSHDLRAPLINLQGFAGELRAALDDIRPALGAVEPHLDPETRNHLRRTLDEDALDSLSFIETSVLRLNDFTHALLRLSRAGHQELSLEDLDLQRLVHQLLDTMAYQIEQCEAEVEVGDLPPLVADRMAMEQVLGNLVGNALNYRAPERPPKILIHGECAGDEVRLRVQDNGRGIAEEDFDKIFAPFRRIGHVDSEGEGVGLAYAQTLVRRHGGRIRCFSTVDVGSEFVVTIPRMPEDRTAS